MVFGGVGGTTRTQLGPTRGIVASLEGVLQAEDPKREAGAVGEVAVTIGGRDETEGTQDGDREVTEGRHHAGRRAITDLGAILVVGHIADPVA